MSPEEFHQLYDDVKPAYEYWFGEAIQKPAADSLHAATQWIVMVLLHARGWIVAPEVTLKLVPDAEPIPDAIASREKLPALYITRPVEICIEILSPEDRLKKTMEKGRHYLEWGIENVWIVDPRSRTAWMMTSEHPDGVWVHPDGKLVAGDTGIALPAIFAEVDRMTV